MKPERYPDFVMFDLAAERQKRESAERERRSREWLEGAWRVLATLLVGVAAAFLGLALAVATLWFWIALAEKLTGG